MSLGITVTPSEIKAYSSALFSGAEITVRDKESQDVLKQIGFNSTIQRDPVFDFVPQKKSIHSVPKTIGMALRAGFLKDNVVHDTVR